MNAARSRKLRNAVLAALALALVAAVFLALRPARVAVETARAARGPLRVTVDATGKTRVRDRFVVLAPVPGHLERVLFRPGDAVRAGDVLARIAPATPPPLDARTRAEAAGRLEAARAAEREAGAARERARAAAEQAERDLERARELARGGSVSASDVEAAEIARRIRLQEAEMAGSAVLRARGEVEAARAVLAGATARPGERIALRAPAAGRVLRVHRESEGPVAAGTAVLEVGDPSGLEVEAELLTTQAVRVRPGATAEIVRWGGDGALRGTVRRVEPAAFTKVSALGVEEQKVMAIVATEGPGWERLGDGWSVEARIVVAERADALLVPSSALFRRRDGWAAFVVEGGVARLREIAIGETSGGEAEVLSGLSAGEPVVLHPSDKLGDGVRVEVRR